MNNTSKLYLFSIMAIMLTGTVTPAFAIHEHVPAASSTLTTPIIVTTGSITDAGGDQYLIFVEATTPVNELTITSADTGAHPSLTASGGDTNINLTLDGKGTGTVRTTSSNLDVTGNIIVSGTVDGFDIGANAASTANTLTQFGTMASTDLLAEFTDETGTGVAVFNISPTLVTPALGTPASGTLTNVNGLPPAGVVGTAVVQTDNISALGGSSSANLAAELSDETGTGLAVFGTSPTLSTPIIATTGSIVDDGGGEYLVFVEATTPANELTITSADAGSEPSLTASGDDTDISLTLDGKGTGTVRTLSSNLDVTGNIIVSGTVDGFDIGANAASTANTLTQFATMASTDLLAEFNDETGTGVAVFNISPTLVTPALGTPASGTLTNVNGLPPAGVVGTAVVQTDNISALGGSSSANLAAELSDETGTGLAVFGTSPTLVTPVIATGGSIVGAANEEYIVFTESTTPVVHIGITSADSGSAAVIAPAGEANAELDINTFGTGALGIGSNAGSANNIIIGNVAQVDPISLNGPTTINADLIHTAREQLDKSAATPTSGDEVTLGADGNYFVLTGTTTINHITKTGWQPGSIVIIEFAGTTTVNHNAGTLAGTETNILLASAAPETFEAAETLMLLMRDTNTFVQIDAGLDSTVRSVDEGGSGAGTFTNGGVLLGSGTGAFTATAVLTEGQLLIGDGTDDPAVATMNGDMSIASGGAATLGADVVDGDHLADTITLDAATTIDTTTAGLLIDKANTGVTIFQVLTGNNAACAPGAAPGTACAVTVTGAGVGDVAFCSLQDADDTDGIVHIGETSAGAVNVFVEGTDTGAGNTNITCIVFDITS